MGARLHKKLTEAVNWYRKEKSREEEIEDEEYKREMGEWRIWRYKERKKKRKVKGKTKLWKKEDIYDEKDEEAEPEGPKRKVDKLQTVIFMQHTKHSELARRVRAKLSELEKVGKIKVKIVERSGTKLQELLHKSNVWEERDCLRDDCWVCTEENLGGKKGQCYKKNITYETYCITCYKKEERERLERERKDKGAEPSSQYGENGMVKEKGVDRENVGGYGSMIGAEPSSKYGQKGMVKEKYNEKKEKKKDGKENSRKEKMEFKVKYIGESSRSLSTRSTRENVEYVT